LPERDQRPRDLARREAIAPRGLQPLVRRDRPFAFHAIGVPGNLSRQRLGERMRRSVDREAPKPLTLPARRAVATEELHPRTRMTPALRASARPHQLPDSHAHATTQKLDLTPDKNPTREATGGEPLVAATGCLGGD
jgi:hypothetical protein